MANPSRCPLDAIPMVVRFQNTLHGPSGLLCFVQATFFIVILGGQFPCRLYLAGISVPCFPPAFQGAAFRSHWEALVERRYHRRRDSRSDIQSLVSHLTLFANPPLANWVPILLADPSLLP